MQRARRTDPKVRHTEILIEAVSCAERVGLDNLARQEIADEIGVRPQLINHYLGDLDAIKSAVLKYAIEHEKLALVAQGLAAKRIKVNDLSHTLRTAVVNYMMTGGTA